MIKFGHTDIRKNDIDRLIKTLRSGWLVNGPVTEKLEKIFCEFTGSSYAVAMNSCTACLHTACVFLKKHLGKKTLKIPDITHVATAHAARMAGLNVKLVDVDPVDGIILPRYVDGNEIIVHLAGQPCGKIHKYTVEDCAHSLGTTYKDGSHAGTKGLCGCFSFYPTKHITSAEGGMLITNNRILAEFARKFRTFGITSSPGERKRPADYDSLFVAPNYRMSDVLAALLIGQLQRFDQNRLHREKIAETYHNGLKDAVVIPSWRNGTSWFIYQVVAGKRDKLSLYLRKNGIQTSIHYRTPLSRMTAYKTGVKIKNSVEFSGKVLSLPVHMGVKKKDAIKIVSLIRRFYGKKDYSADNRRSRIHRPSSCAVSERQRP